jgi:hypothetical protein
MSDYDRRVNAFNQKRPRGVGRPGWQSRVTSWSDPISATRDILDEDVLEGHDGSGGRSRSGSGSRARTWSRDSFGATDGGEVGVTVSGDEAGGLGDGERRRRLFRHRSGRRRHSFHDLSSFGHVRVLHAERMRIDVELAGQLLIMLRREEHLQNVLACLQVRLRFSKHRLCILLTGDIRPSRRRCLPRTRRYGRITSPTNKYYPISQPAPK